MGALDGFLNMMKMRGDEDDYEEDYDGYDEEESYEAPRKPARKSEPVVEQSYEAEAPAKKPAKNILPQKTQKNVFNTPKKGAIENNMEICKCKPTSFEDAPQIADALLENTSVVMNLEGLDLELAQRIFDFVTGACYALKGRLEPISKYVYVITPENVYISGDTNDQGVLGKGFTN